MTFSKIIDIPDDIVTTIKICIKENTKNHFCKLISALFRLEKYLYFIKNLKTSGTNSVSRINVIIGTILFINTEKNFGKLYSRFIKGTNLARYGV